MRKRDWQSVSQERKKVRFAVNLKRECSFEKKRVNCTVGNEEKKSNEITKDESCDAMQAMIDVEGYAFG